jgi:hypothetical protein
MQPRLASKAALDQGLAAGFMPNRQALKVAQAVGRQMALDPDLIPQWVLFHVSAPGS